MPITNSILPKNRWKVFRESWWAIPAFLLALSALGLFTYCGLRSYGVFNHPFGVELLLRWDAGFYAFIRDQGYRLGVGETDAHAGFFPLFAYFWRWTHLDAVGITLLNFTLVTFALAFLAREIRSSFRVVGIYWSLPFIFFLFLPQSEGLFFVFTVGVLVGIHQKRWSWVTAFLFLAAVTRPTAIFFAPAGLVAIFFADASIFSHSLRKVRKWLLVYALPVASGVGVVLLVQYWQTGEWNLYFRIQRQFWERVFSWPAIPFGRGAHDHPLLEQLYRLSFAIGLMAATLLVVLGIRRLLPRFRSAAALLPVHWFCLVYLTLSVAGVAFFNPKWYWHGAAADTTTTLMGINRYVVPNACLFVLLDWLYRQKVNWKWLIPVAFCFIHGVIFLLEPRFYVHVKTMGWMHILTLLLLPYLLYFVFPRRVLAGGLILYGFLLQAYVFDLYLAGVQID